MIKFLLAGLALAVLCFTTYDAQGAVFLKIDSIPGDSTVAGHENEILISSYQFGASLPVAISGGGGGAGKASFSDLELTKTMDKSSPKFFADLTTGKSLPKAEIFLTKNNGGKQFTFAHYTMENVLISSYSVSSGGDTPSESIGLNYAKLQTETTPQNPDGSLGTPVSFCWDSILNKACVPADTIPPTLSISSPANNTITSVTTQTVSGTASDDTSISSVTWRVDSGAISTASTSDSFANWSFVASALPDGIHEIQINATDLAGLVTTKVLEITIDTIPPTLSVSSPGNNTIIKLPTPAISGTSSDDTSVSLVTWKLDSGSVSTATGTTSWTFVSPTLLLGNHAFQINATDAVGLVTSKILAITYAAPKANLTSPSGIGQITFAANNGGFTSLGSIPAGSLLTPPPPDSYPLGFFTWSITGFAPAPSVTIQITSPVPLFPQSHYFKLVGGTWVSIPVIVSGNKMNITITDNGPFDGNSLAGTISDPGAITNPTNGRITGGGSIGTGIEFGFEVKSDLTKTKSIKGELEYHDKSAKLNVHSEKITFLSVDTTVSQATFLGSLDLDKNHKGYSFIATISDPDKKGDHDKFSITISDNLGKVIYQKSGNVKGHIEIHKFFDKDDKSDSGVNHNNDNDKNKGKK